MARSRCNQSGTAFSSWILITLSPPRGTSDGLFGHGQRNLCRVLVGIELLHFVAFLFGRLSMHALAGLLASTERGKVPNGRLLVVCLCWDEPK